MKKFILSIVCFCMLFMNLSAIAAPDAKTYEGNISVYGRLEAEREGDDVSILVYDNDTTLDKLDRVLHIGMTKVQYGGEYQYKFKYTMPLGKTLDDYTVMAKIGADDITKSTGNTELEKKNLLKTKFNIFTILCQTIKNLLIL